MFSYFARFEPAKRKDGYPKLRAAEIFIPKMGLRFASLQEYLSSVSSHRDIRPLGTGPCGNSGNVEVGYLRDLFENDFTLSDKTGDPHEIGRISICWQHTWTAKPIG
ncbi:MAG: hypothetical protein HY051_05115 [Candidatus Aenigmarchaeota archaeon]|nr:hypothetical protein [Candidatus Aenigmarchaeota archaeon]